MSTKPKPAEKQALYFSYACMSTLLPTYYLITSIAILYSLFYSWLLMYKFDKEGPPANYKIIYNTTLSVNSPISSQDYDNSTSYEKDD